MSEPTSIEGRITELLKESMRNKDQRTADTIRMIKTKHMERRTAAGFKGPLDDNLWLDVIAAYQKQLKKAREEYAGLGERGAEHLPQIDFEIEFTARFLPKLASEEEVRDVVRAAAAKLGIADAKSGAGKIMGEVMKTHKGKVEAPVLKRIIDEVLAPR